MKKYLFFYNFVIIILNALIINSLQILKTIHLSNNNYYMITTDNLYYYTDGNTTNTKNIINMITFLNDQIITTYEESEMNSLSHFESSSIIIIIKHYIYSVSNDNFFCYTCIDELKGYYSEVFAIKCSSGYCYFIVGIITTLNKQLQLFLVQISSIYCQISNISYIEINNVNSENINCQLMESPSDGQVLTCFYQSSNEIIASSFKIIIGEIQEIELITSLKKSKINDSARIIKSIISQDKKKAFVCYTNNDKNCYCLTYNITNNEWSDYNIYLNDCLLEISSLNIDYSYNKNEYIIYCFQSTTKFNIQKFDENFEKKEDDENGNYDLINSLKNCNEYNLSSLEYESNNINMFVICDNNIKKLEIKDSKIIISITSSFIDIPSILSSKKTTLSFTEIPSTLLSIEDHKNIIIQLTSDKSKEYIISNIDKAINDYDINKIYEIFGEDYNIKIYPINLKQNINTYIDFSNCEQILREKNGLSESSILIVYQIEIYNINQQSLNNHIEYAIFNEKKEKLELSECKNELIKINYQINASMINTTKVNYYAELGIDIFNIKDNFFNDICYSYSEGDSDIILNDRVTDIYQNFSFCENNCIYNTNNLIKRMKTNSQTISIDCICKVNTEINITKNSLNFNNVAKDTFKDLNIAIILCYNLVFNLHDKLNNIGFIIFLIPILIHIPIFIYYFINGIKSIQMFISKYLEKNNFIVKEEKKASNKKVKNVNIKNVNIKGTILNNISNNNSLNPFIQYEHNNNINNIKENKKQEEKIYIKENIKKKKKKKKKKRKKKQLKVIQTTDFIENKKNIVTKNNNSKIIIKFESKNMLNYYNYENAIKHDKRSFCRIYYISLVHKQNILNIFLIKSPLEIKALQLSLLIFNYSCDIALNALFYFNKNISDKYHYQGEYSI